MGSCSRMILIEHHVFGPKWSSGSASARIVRSDHEACWSLFRQETPSKKSIYCRTPIVNRPRTNWRHWMKSDCVYSFNPLLLEVIEEQMVEVVDKMHFKCMENRDFGTSIGHSKFSTSSISYSAPFKKKFRQVQLETWIVNKILKISCISLVVGILSKI